MKLVVVDLDNLPLLIKYRKIINANKICTLTYRDFGKKTLYKLPKLDPIVLDLKAKYIDLIYKLKDDNYELRYEDKLFKELRNQIEWVRVGVILRRDKAVKILLKLLGR